MNSKGTIAFTNYVQTQRVMLLNTLKVGEGRTLPQREENYDDMVHHLGKAGVAGAIEKDVTEAVKIFTAAIGRPLEVSKPPNDNGAARKLATLIRDTSAQAQFVIEGVDVRLDIDQMKHQSMQSPIGTRNKSGGNRFIATCNAAWHRGATMLFMARWATALGPMPEGSEQVQRQLLAQTSPLFEGAIHFEGKCLMAGGQKYVLFHCYPASTNRALLGPKA